MTTRRGLSKTFSLAHVVPHLQYSPRTVVRDECMRVVINAVKSGVVNPRSPVCTTLLRLIKHVQETVDAKNSTFYDAVMDLVAYVEEMPSRESTTREPAFKEAWSIVRTLPVKSWDMHIVGNVLQVRPGSSISAVTLTAKLKRVQTLIEERKIRRASVQVIFPYKGEDHTVMWVDSHDASLQSSTGYTLVPHKELKWPLNGTR